MTIGRFWQWIDAVQAARPVRFGDAFLTSLTWYVLLVSVFAVIHAGAAGMFYMLGRLQPGYQFPFALFQLVLSSLPILPLLWIRASLRVNFFLALAGLAVLFVIGFANRNFFGRLVDAAELEALAVLYLLVWLGNRVEFWWRHRKGIET